MGGTGANDTRDGLTVGTSKATIQAAITAAVDGDTVQVAAGTYTENVTIGVPITVKCANFGVAGSATRTSETIIRGFATASPKNLPAAVRITVGGVVIDGCAFARHVVSGTTEGIHVNAVPKMIESSGVSGETIIRNSRFDLATSGSTPSCGSAIWGTADWRISSNYFANHKYSTVCSDTTYAASSGVYNSRVIFAEGAPAISVTGNVFENSGHAVYLTGLLGTGGSIEGNTFNVPSGTAIVLGVRTGVLIRGNTFSRGGVFLDGSRDTSIVNNLFCGRTDGSSELGLTPLFDGCQERTTYALWSSSGTGTIMKGNAVLGSYPTTLDSYAGKTVFLGSSSTTALEDNWWGEGVIQSGINGKTVSAETLANDPSRNPASFITAYTFDSAKTGTPGFWPTCVTLSDATRTVDQAVLPCPQPAQGSGSSAPAPVPVVPAPAASPPASQSPGVTPAAVNAQIRGLPLPAAAIALLEGELAGVLIDGEPVEVRILTAEEIIADAQALFGESSRLSLSPDSQLLNIANFDGTQSLEVNLADVKIIQIGSIRIALLSVGTSEGERGQNDDGKLVVQPDDQLVAVATGLPPLAAFRAFFFSTPSDLGTVVADGNGEVLLTAVLPAETTPGDHTLQLTTSTPEGGLVQIAIPVVIAEPVVEMVESEPETVVAEGEAADGSPVTPLLWVLIGALVLVAIVTTVILVARSRRA